MLRKKFAFVICVCLLVPSSVLTYPADIFMDYLADTVPYISETVDKQHEENGVLVREVIFRVNPETYIDLHYAYPMADGRYPGILLLHDTGGVADKTEAMRWAKKGYATVSFDIPGIADKARITKSYGTFMTKIGGYGDIEPDITSSTLYDAEITVISALKLLRKNTKTDSGKIGIVAKGWSANLAILTAGLMQGKVNALYLENGASAFSQGTYFFEVNQFSGEKQKLWTQYYDGLSVAPRVDIPVFAASTLSNPFFYPTSIEETLNALSGSKTLLLTPDSLPGNNDIVFMDYQLKGEGTFSDITVIANSTLTDGAKMIAVSADTNSEPVGAYIHYSGRGVPFPFKKWSTTTGNWKDRGYVFVLPAEVLANTDYLIEVRYANGTAVSTGILSDYEKSGGNPFEQIKNGTFDYNTAFWNTDCGAELFVEEGSICIKPFGYEGSSVYQMVSLEQGNCYSAKFCAKANSEQSIAMIIEPFGITTHRSGKRIILRPEQKMNNTWQEFSFHYKHLAKNTAAKVWFKSGDGTVTEPFFIDNVSLSALSDSSISITQQGNTLDITGKITSNVHLYKDSQLFVGVYSSDGMLTKVYSQKAQIGAETLIFNLNIPAPDNGNVKAFLWYDFIPLTQCVIK